MTSLPFDKSTIYTYPCGCKLVFGEEKPLQSKDFLMHESGKMWRTVYIDPKSRPEVKEIALCEEHFRGKNWGAQAEKLYRKVDQNV